MKKLLANLAFIFVTSSTLIAQADFQKGYIVKLNGDTLLGYVNFQKQGINNSSCNFKRFEIAIPVIYTPEKLKAYGINGGKQFVSLIFNEKPVFAEYLVKGKISLLYLNKGSEHYFSKFQDNPPVELKSGKTIDPINNQTFDSYKIYLKSVFLPIELANEIDDSKLTIPSLTNLIKNYNELSNVFYEVPNRPKEKSLIKDYSILGTNKIKFGILGGMNCFFFTPTSNDGAFNYIEKAEFKPAIFPVGGFFIKGNFSKKVPLSYQLDFLYQEISIYGFAKTEIRYRSILVYDDIFIDYKEVCPLFKLNYVISRNKFLFEPHLGVGFSYRLNSNYKRLREEYNEDTQIVKSYEHSDLPVLDNEVILVGGLTIERQISSARWIILNLDYEYGNRVVETMRGSSAKDGLKGASSVVMITAGITL